jgi:hypothetical protein
VNALDRLPRRRPTRDIGLIRNDHEYKPARFQRTQSVRYSRQYPQVVRRSRRARHAIAQQDAIDDPVTIQENG